MECKDCKIVCDGIEMAAVSCDKGGFSLKMTEKGKELCKDRCKGCC